MNCINSCVVIGLSSLHLWNKSPQCNNLFNATTGKQRKEVSTCAGTRFYIAVLKLRSNAGGDGDCDDGYVNGGVYVDDDNDGYKEEGDGVFGTSLVVSVMVFKCVVVTFCVQGQKRV